MSCLRTQHSDACKAEPMAPRSRVKHSTTESLCSLTQSHNDDFGGRGLKRVKQHDTHHWQDLVTSNKYIKSI